MYMCAYTCKHTQRITGELNVYDAELHGSCILGGENRKKQTNYYNFRCYNNIKTKRAQFSKFYWSRNETYHVNRGAYFNVWGCTTDAFWKNNNDKFYNSQGIWWDRSLEKGFGHGVYLTVTK